MRNSTGSPTAITQRLCDEFSRLFGSAPRVFRAPGRVNIIGEHTDYNDGFVMPAALEQSTFVAISPRPDRLIRAYSLDLGSGFEFDLDTRATPQGDWSDYVRGVTAELENSEYPLRGANLAIATTLPIGAGLSTSAALEVSVGYALLSISGLKADLLELAQICQRAENDFVGMRCGVMDQYISCLGVESCALLLDCRSLQARPIRLPDTLRLVVSNTMIHHQLASSAFNRRRRECEEAVARLSQALGGVRSLRDVEPAQIEHYAAMLPDPILRRARHVTSENARVLAMAAALDAKDYAVCGRLMNTSHASLRDDYEVSCKELDFMADLAREVEGVYGARMTGGGFGGCVISLVEADAVARFVAHVGPAYEARTGLKPTIFSCFPSAGVGPFTAE